MKSTYEIWLNSLRQKLRILKASQTLLTQREVGFKTIWNSKKSIKIKGASIYVQGKQYGTIQNSPFVKALSPSPASVTSSGQQSSYMNISNSPSR